MTTHGKVSVAAARRKATGLLRQAASNAGHNESTSSALGGGRPAGTPGAQETSRAKRIAAQGGLAALFHDALVWGQSEAREERDAQDAAPPANSELLAAIERSLLRAKQERLCFDCGKYPATTRSGLCSRCYVFNKC